MENLKDIKDIVDVPEYSLFILIAIVTMALLLISVAFYFYKNRRKRRKKPTQKEMALQKLRDIDYNNTKEVVYTFEAEIKPFITPENQERLNAIKKELEVYKYKKDIPQLDNQIKVEIESFIKGLK
jgi:hypothetical protein